MKTLCFISALISLSVATYLFVSYNKTDAAPSVNNSSGFERESRPVSAETRSLAGGDELDRNAERIVTQFGDQLIDYKSAKERGFDLISKARSVGDLVRLRDYFDLEVVNRNLKSDLVGRVLGELAERGELKTALSLVTEQPGAYRGFQLSSIYSVAKITHQKFSEDLNGFTDAQEKLYVTAGYLGQLREDGDALQIISKDDFPKFSGNLERLFANTLRHLAEKSSSPQHAEEFQSALRKMFDDGRLSAESTLSILNSTGSAEEKLKSIFKYDRLSESESYGNLIRRIAGDYVLIDPKGAMKAITFQENIVPEAIDGAFGKWLQFNALEAMDWYGKNANLLSPGAASQITATAAKFASEKLEFDTAREWVEKIGDPQVRKVTENAIWNAEKEVVTSRVQANPQQFLDEMIAGSSGHPNYWIQTGYSEWLKQSPDDASDWYGKNRKFLTPSQNQHVARVYAEQAIKNSDFEIANQWLGQVADEKFREPLIRRLAEAQK